MKINKFILIILNVLFFILFIPVPKLSAQEAPKIYFFYGTGCPHCSVIENYFAKEDFFNKYPIEKKEIFSNRENDLLFSRLLSERGIPLNQQGVPAVVMGDKVLMGDQPIIESFVSEADRYLAQLNNPVENQPEREPLFPKLNLTLAAVIGASIVDAINPCAFAVLIILMTTILATGDGKKALYAGFAFAFSIFLSYFLMGIGLYQALGLGGFSVLFFKIVGWLALILGLLNLKDYFWYGKGFLMEVPLSWRPKLKSLIKSATTPLGAFGVGFLVSLILLPCTSGPYIVILGMLASNTLIGKAVLYLLLYNLIFVSPMLLISYAVYKGFDPNKAEEIRQKRLRTLHLIAGILMLAMGIVIIRGWV